MARKNKFDSVIKKNYKKIEQLLSSGMTEKKVAESLGVAYSTWNKYKADNKEFSELIIKSREKPVENLVNRMYESGMGMTRTIKRAMKMKKAVADPFTGKTVLEDVIEYYDEEIYIPPNFQAAKFLILNWGEGWSSEPKAMELRERELNHKIEMDKENNW